MIDQTIKPPQQELLKFSIITLGDTTQTMITE